MTSCLVGSVVLYTIDAVGAVLSMRKVIFWFASTFPARSIDRYSRVYIPSCSKVSGIVYGSHIFPPSKLYTTDATPDLSSVALSVACTLLIYQPLRSVPSSEAIVVGGVMSVTIHCMERNLEDNFPSPIPPPHSMNPFLPDPSLSLTSNEKLMFPFFSGLIGATSDQGRDSS